MKFLYTCVEILFSGVEVEDVLNVVVKQILDEIKYSPFDEVGPTSVHSI